MNTPSRKIHKKRLLEKQKNRCNGCHKKWTPESNDITIDHITPLSKDGKDQWENKQLLCEKCNKLKGNHDMEYLKKKLREEKLRTKKAAKKKRASRKHKKGTVKKAAKKRRA